MNDTATAIPPEYMENAQGNLVPVGNVRAIDRERDDLVNEMIEHAKELQALLSQFKTKSFEDVTAFVQLSAEQYEVKIGGEKGNVSLVSYNGEYKITRTYSETLTFDERLQAAKALIDECISSWVDGANDNIRVLVNGAFEVDKEGNISTAKVLSLRQYEIHDDKWKRAMQAISESLQVSGRKGYIRFYERNSQGGYDPISLDIAAV